MNFQECAACLKKPGSPDLCPACLHNRTLIGHLLELQKAAEKVEGPHEWFHDDIKPQIVELHRIIRKVRRMK